MHKKASLFTAIFVILAFMIVALYFWKSAGDPSSSLLVPEHGAQWIRVNERVIPNVRTTDPIRAFKTTVYIDKVPDSAVLIFKAMKDAEVLFDGQLVHATDGNLNDWREPIAVDLAGYLTPGAHTLRVTVINEKGPALLLAYSETLGIRTGHGWKTSKDGVEWKDALAATAPMSHPSSIDYPVASSFVKSLPILLPVFLATFFLTLAYYRCGNGNGGRIARFMADAGTLRWLIIASLTVLGVNNFFNVPVGAGFDRGGHIEYINFVAEKLSLPYASDGWQMFQSPLYYMISAVFHRVLKPLIAENDVIRVLKLFTFAFAIAQVEITYRMLKKVFRDRPELVSLGVVIGGLLPANLYVSLSLGNEAMCGFFSAAALAVAFQILVDPGSPSRRRLVLLGALFGLALLSKVTAVLLLLPIGFLLLYKAKKTGLGGLSFFSLAFIAFVTAFAVSSWYYIRNWIKLGSFFVGGWDAAREIVWWQDPGYRTLDDFYRFGKSLTHPIFSNYNGFWDSYYSTLWLDGMMSGAAKADGFPPWNIDFMVSGAWLALLPTAAILIAIIAALTRPDESFRKGPLLAVMCLVIYVAALAYMYLQVPIHSTLKASYTTGLTPVYALLAASGLGMIMKTAAARALIYGWVACWAVFAYCSYFAV